MNEQYISSSPVTTDKIEAYTTCGVTFPNDMIEIKNSDNIEIYGNDEQRIAMFKDWSLYFGEITNPENTVANAVFRGAKYSPLNIVLNTLRPVLSKYGLSIVQTPYMSNGDVCVRTIVIHKDGGVMAFPQASSKLVKPNNAVSEIQAFGSISTYLRRFILNSIGAVCGEIDDDGNSLAEKQKPKEPTPEELELKKLQEEIIKVSTEKIEKGIDKEIPYQIISEKNNNKRNPNSIKDIDVAKEILAEIKKLKNDKKKEEEINE